MSPEPAHRMAPMFRSLSARAMARAFSTPVRFSMMKTGIRLPRGSRRQMSARCWYSRLVRPQ